MHLMYSPRVGQDDGRLGLVEHREPFLRLFDQGQILRPDGERMTKSRGNVVDRTISSRATALIPSALFLMFMGPGTRADRGARPGSVASIVS